MKEKRYYYFDFIRFIAALVVMMVHIRCGTFVVYSELDPSSQNTFVHLFYAFTYNGALEVCMFFLLSGFLTGGRVIEKFRQGTISSGKYAIGRFTRMSPPFIIAIILAIICNYITHTDFSWSMIIGNLFGLQGIACSPASYPFWTISYEIWFYVMVLSILLIAERKRYAGLPLLLLSACMFISLKSEYFFILLAGVGGYYLKDMKFHKSITIVCATLAIIFALLYFVSDRFASQLPLDIVLDRRLMLFIFSFSFLIVMSQISMCEPTQKWQKIIEGIGRKCAPISYSLYLTHSPIITIVNYFRGNVYDSVNFASISTFLINCIIAVIFAWLVYWLIEKRTPIIQKWLSSRFNI